VELSEPTSNKDAVTTASAEGPEAERLHALRDSHFRSLFKAVSWRIVGTIDTIVVSYLWTGEVRTAVIIGSTEVVTKVGLYYLHERLWSRIPLGTVRRHLPFPSEQPPHGKPLKDSNWRSLLKAISWRGVGTLDTFLVSYFWTHSTGKALFIGGTDMLTKIVLYYLHERAWTRIPLGTIRRIFDKQPAAIGPDKSR
jgi:uncharacterized membrane protein